MEGNSILTNLNFPDGELDIKYQKNFDKRANKWRENNQRAIYITNKTNFSYLNSEQEYEINFWVVSFKITADTYGYLITNLLKEESSLQELKELYLMRLSIKNAFLILKYTIGMLFFHSKKRQLSKQEIYVFIFYSVTLIFKERYSI